jgi:putative transposase
LNCRIARSIGSRGDRVEHAVPRASSPSPKQERVVPLGFENSTLSSHRSSFAASRLRHSHNQIFNNRTPSAYSRSSKAVLRRPLEPGQYTSYVFGQVLDDHGVLGSIGSVGDAFDNAMAESFVDSFKTELIVDRVWRTRSQLELAVVEYVGWFNHIRLHEALGDIPPVEFEQAHAATAAISGNGSVAVLSPRPADRLYRPRFERERAGDAQTALSAITVPGPASPATIT